MNEEFQQYEFFTANEMQCPCGCGLLPKHSFMLLLDELRRQYGEALPVTSGARCKEYTKLKGYGPAHTKLVAADVHVYGGNVIRLISIAHSLGFRGIGAKQHGPVNERFIHLDRWNDYKYRPAFWTY